MIGQWRAADKSHESSSGRTRRGRRVLGIAGAAGTFLAAGLVPVTALPAANADIDDLFQPIIDAVSQAAAAPGPEIDDLVAFAPVAAAGHYNPVQWLEQDWLSSPLHQAVDSLINSASVALTGQVLIDHDTIPWPGIDASWLFGGAAGDPRVDVALPPNSVPLEVRVDTQPVLSLTVNGGWNITALADTGSESLTVPWYYLGLSVFPWPTGFGTAGYSGGLEYLYATVKVPVDFGDGIVTAPTDIHAVLAAWPKSWENFFNPDYWSIEGYQREWGGQAILGLGPNADESSGVLPVTMALPGALGQGVLINQAGGYLQFGPNPLDPGTSIAVAGAPLSPLQVSIDDGPLHTVPASIDSGGIRGTMPSSVLEPGQLPANLPPGTKISVYTGGEDPILLYSYTTTLVNTPTVDPTEGAVMNTGNMPFALQPIYISNAPHGVGMTIFGSPG